MRNTIIKSDSMRELLRLPKPIPPGDPAEFISKVAQLVDDLEFAEAAPDEARATIQNVLATSFVDLTPERIPVIMLPVALHLARLYDGDTAQSMFAVFSLIDVSLARSAKVVATLCRRIISELALDAFTSERLLRAA